MASKQILDEIRSRISIVSLIGEVVPLKKAGRNFRGLCPFHQEKTPSFMVTEDKQIFHCFGCGMGGDCFTFFMKFHNLSFPEALKDLAKRAGVQLPDFSPGQTKADQELARRKELGFSINNLAAQHFTKTLLDTTKGRLAQNYLAGRGLKKEILTEHQLGFADKGWDGLYKALQAANIPLKLAEELGLIRKGKTQEGFYDFFRERIIFPIYDAQGNIIGFGGRTIQQEEPKYLNSSDSFLYNKSRTVYGLNFAKEAIRKKDEVILVEGYVDCIALRQAGILNVVAPLGTSLTKEHVQLLCRYTKNFVLAFDGDEAGSKAAFRSLPIFLEFHLTPKAIELPKGTDPDSFIQKEGEKGWNVLQTKAPTLFEYFVTKVLALEGEGTQAKIKTWERIKPLFEKVQNELEAGMLRRMIAGKLGVEEGWLGKVPGTFGAPPPKGARHLSGTFFPEEERLLIAAILLAPATVKTIQQAGEVFQNPLFKKIATQLFERSADKGVGNIADLPEGFPEDLSRWVREMALTQGEENVWEKAVDDCLKKIEAKNLEKQVQTLNQKISLAETQGDEKGLLQLLSQKNRLFGGKTV